MGKFAKLTSPPKIYYTLTYFLLGRYFFLNSQTNSGHLHKKVRGISQQFKKKITLGISGKKTRGHISAVYQQKREELKKVRRVGHLRKKNPGGSSQQ